MSKEKSSHTTMRIHRSILKKVSDIQLIASQREGKIITLEKALDKFIDIYLENYKELLE